MGRHREYEVTAGQMFGCWTVIAADGSFALCKCKCDNIKQVAVRTLLRGESLSCGCRGKDGTEKQYVRQPHGMSGTRLYKIWLELRRLNKNKRKRVVLYPAWEADFMKFREWAIQSGYTDSHTLVRNRHWEGHKPENCFWEVIDGVSFYQKDL